MAKTLPEGYTFHKHGRTKVRFVCTPDRKLIPNQGGRPGKPEDTDQQIIDDFYYWYEINVLGTREWTPNGNR